MQEFATELLPLHWFDSLCTISYPILRRIHLPVVARKIPLDNHHCQPVGADEGIVKDLQHGWSVVFVVFRIQTQPTGPIHLDKRTHKDTLKGDHLQVPD